MEHNPFANFQLEIPKERSETIKTYTKTGEDTWEFSPFERQVDFWYFCFCYAVMKKLDPVRDPNMSNITPASILSNDDYRISHIQLAYIGYHETIDDIADHRKVFTFAIEMANAGMLAVLTILKDPDENPIWNLCDFIEKEIR